MSKNIDELAGWLLDVVEGRLPWQDILEKEPDLSHEDAYRVQHAVMKRKAAGGDPVVGFKAGMTSQARQRELGITEPVVGTVLASAILSEGTRVPFLAGWRMLVEAEIGVVLKSDLPGPNATVMDAFQAVAGYVPAIEVGGGPTGNKRSHPMTLATQKLYGYVIYGGPVTAPYGIDLRTEGVVITINDETRGSACAVEVMGNPLNAVACMANMLHRSGAMLKAGMTVMSGSILPGIAVEPGDAVRLDYTRLGSVGCRFAG